MNKLIQWLLFIFILFNPLFLHLGNLVSSDCIFAALSFFWFGLIVWILNQPSKINLILHAVTLFFLFTIRYNALIYPLLSITILSIASINLKKKLLHVVVCILLCGSFVSYTAYKFYKISGIWQYSPFSGWQLANNAMYAYRYIDAKNRVTVPSKYQHLDKMIREYFDSTRDVNQFPIEKIQASSFYMWSLGLPLMKYKEKVNAPDSNASDLKKWARMGPLYFEYGKFIIGKYPFTYLRYFIWPNALKYFAPPLEFLESYNSGRSNVKRIAKNWFQYSSLNVKTRFPYNDIYVLSFFPILTGVINAIMIFGFLACLYLRVWKFNREFWNIFFIGWLLWFLNAIFTITASSVALRFQSFPIVLTCFICALQIDVIWKMSRSQLTFATNSTKGIPIVAD